MSKKESGGLSFLVVVLWGLIAVALFALLRTFVGQSPASPVSEGGASPTDPISTSTSTPPATQTSEPSLTPTPAPPPPLVGMVLPDAPFPEKLVPFWEGPIVIGYSVEGRPLEVYRFGTGDRKVMVVAGIHGGYEANTIALADELIAYIVEHPDVISEDSTLYLLRALNPDGLARLPDTLEGRANANGVDLNRNWGVDWQPEWELEGCWSYRPLSAGDYAASEPETLALMGFLLENPVVALVSYHSAAPGIYPAGEPRDPDSVDLARALSGASGYPYPGTYLGCQLTGTLVDWVASIGPAAVDVELTDHQATDFEQNLALLQALLVWQP